MGTAERIKNDHKGFTLIELVVAIAIASIVVAIIGSILVISSRSYASTSTEAGIQSDAQIVMNQVQDLVIDTTNAIKYTYDNNDNNSVTTDSEIPATAAQKSLYMYNAKIIYEIRWDRTAGTITYYEYPTLDGKTKASAVPTETDILAGDTALGEYVTSFACDLSHVADKRIVAIEMDFEKGGKSYHAANNISLRNRIGVSANTISADSSVSINDFALIGEPGMTLPLGGNRVVITGDNASSEVYYELRADSGCTSTGTKISDDKHSLIIDPKERAAQIMIHVRSASTTAEGLLYVNIARVSWTQATSGVTPDTPNKGEAISISGLTGDTIEVKAGSSYVFTPSIDIGKCYVPTGSDTVKLTAVDGGTVVSGAADASYDSATKTITVNSTAAVGSEIKVRFTAVHSTASGGMSIRTSAYPTSAGVYKDFTVKVVKNSAPKTGENIARGSTVTVYDNGLIGAMGSTNGRYIFYRVAGYRDVIDSAGNVIDYPSDNAGWTYINGSAVREENWTSIPSTSNTDRTKWVKMSDSGSSGLIQSQDLQDLPLNEDYIIELKAVAWNNVNGGGQVIVEQSSTGRFYMKGLRTAIKQNTSSVSQDSYDLGTYYKLDGSFPTNLPTTGSVLYTQKDACITEWQNADKWYFSTESQYAALTGVKVDPSQSPTEYYTPPYSTGFNRSLSIQFNNVNNWLGSETADGKYYIWSYLTFSNINSTYASAAMQKLFSGTTELCPRKTACFTITIKTGNITVNGLTGFVPYPAHGSKAAHSSFWGNGQTLTSDYRQVLVYSANPTFNYFDASGNKKQMSYQSYMKYVNGVYYLYLNSVGEYYYDDAAETWVLSKAEPTEYNATLINMSLAGSSYYDAYIPYPALATFYGTGMTKLSASWTMLGLKSIRTMAGQTACYCWLSKDSNSIYYLYIAGKGIYSCSSSGTKWSVTPFSSNCAYNVGTQTVFVPAPGSPDCVFTLLGKPSDWKAYYGTNAYYLSSGNGFTGCRGRIYYRYDNGSYKIKFAADGTVYTWNAAASAWK